MSYENYSWLFPGHAPRPGSRSRLANAAVCPATELQEEPNDPGTKAEGGVAGGNWGGLVERWTTLPSKL